MAILLLESGQTLPQREEGHLENILSFLLITKENCLGMVKIPFNFPFGSWQNSNPARGQGFQDFFLSFRRLPRYHGKMI
jgi:hypothetical protein